MNLWARQLALGLLLTAAIPPAAVRAADSAEQILLDRAAYWRLKDRPDLARDSLDKVLAHNPSQADALYAYGVLELQQGNVAKARGYLSRLRLVAPGDARLAGLQSAVAAGRVDTAGAGNTIPPARSAGDMATGAGSSMPAVADAPPPLETTVKSADSDDLTAAPPTADRASLMQVASPPTKTVSAGGADTTTAPVASGGNSRPQLAQLELNVPGPVGGYQPPIDTGPVPAQDSLQLDIERSMAAIEAETSPTLQGGIVYRGREGTSGVSSLSEVGLPVEATFAPWLTGTMKAAVSPVWLDSGSVPSSSLAQFGANEILSANGLGMVSPSEQSEAGVIASLSYTYGPYSAKIGEVAWGFPVTNIIGNLAYQPKFLDDTLSVRIELLREPVTDSLLSYAGTRASLSPANAVSNGAFGTNHTWGGVTKTGVRGAVFYDDNNIGAFAIVGGSYLDGTNVPENSSIEAVAGAYFRPWRNDTDALRVGVNLTYFGFDKNLSFYSFGQGGYFSPANYEALTFPVEYQGRWDRWSYLAAVALGVQHFNSDSTPFFPNNPNAQAALVNLVGTSAAVYPGTSSTGLATDLRAQVEYAVDKDLSVGASAQYDNGNDYNEGIFKLYVRKTFSDPPAVTAILPGTPMSKPQ